MYVGEIARSWQSTDELCGYCRLEEEDTATGESLHVKDYKY